MSRASEKILGKLHLRLAESMLARLESGDTLTAAEWTSIASFLKNNGIEAARGQNPALEAMQAKVVPLFDDPDSWDGRSN